MTILKFTENFMSDTIKYKIGKLYLGNEKNEIRKNVICIYDKNSKNVHIYEDNTINMRKIENVVEKLIELTVLKLKQNYCSDEYVIWDNRGGGKIKVDGIYQTYSDSNQYIELFKFISIKNKGTGIKYELNFMRFFVDSKNRINCILGFPQFDVCKGDINAYGICYPHTFESEVGQLDNIINIMENHYGRKNYCYNPGIEGLESEKDNKGNYIVKDGIEYLNSYAERLAKEFIDFITKNEKYRDKSIEGE